MGPSATSAGLVMSLTRRSPGNRLPPGAAATTTEIVDPPAAAMPTPEQTPSWMRRLGAHG